MAARKARPVLSGSTMLFDRETGQYVALAEGDELPERFDGMVGDHLLRAHRKADDEPDGE